MASKAGIAVAVGAAVATPPTIYFTHKFLTSYLTSERAPVISIPSEPIPAATLNHKRDEGKAFENNQGCIKEKFTNLTEIKSNLNASSTTKTDSDKQSLASHSGGTIDGCLTTDLMWRNTTPKQHAIAGTIEMTLTKENHGLIFRTLITNLFEGDTAFQYINQVFKLTKETSGQWKIDDGYLWTDESYQNLSNTSNRDPIYLIFDGLIKADISYWDLCKRGTVASGSNDQTCNQIQTTDKSFAPLRLQKQKWTSNSGGKGIFQHLTISAGKKGEEKPGNLWGRENKDLFKEKLDCGIGPYLYEKDNGFYKIEHNNEGKAKTNLTKWFEPFKDAKGSWSVK